MLLLLVDQAIWYERTLPSARDNVMNHVGTAP